MALILSIETSASACSVALHKEGQLVHTIEIAEPQAHAGKLAVLIQELLKATSISPKDLTAVAVSAGPGSYTGLRIGTSVAKGLCLGLQIPLITIPTLLSMAHHVNQVSKDKFLCPLIDARRMEVYTQIFDNHLTPVNDTEAVVVDSNSFRELLDTQQVLFFGDGAEKCKSVINHPNAGFVDDVHPKAVFIGAVAWHDFKANRFADLVEFTPFYLKEFVAKKAQPIF